MPRAGKDRVAIFFNAVVLGVLIAMFIDQPCVLFRIDNFANPKHLPAIVEISFITSSIDVKLSFASDAIVCPFQLRLAMM